MAPKLTFTIHAGLTKDGLRVYMGNCPPEVQYSRVVQCKMGRYLT